jgi:Tfp pilus assembly protein PilO
MNKLPKEKRDKLILVIMGSVMMLGLIYFGLIRPQFDTLSKIKIQTSNARNKLQKMEDTVKRAEATHDEMIDALDTLSHSEQDLASGGDTFQWTYDMMRGFKASYKTVDMPGIGQSVIGDVDFLPGFPYKQIKVTVTGTAFYHDLGKFIADFENTYPHIRVANISMEPAGATGDDSEKLAFKMDIIALIKQNTP